MSKVRINRGTEGPRHDPYSFTEITVTRADGAQVTFHEGLAIWAKVKGGESTDPFYDPIGAAELFERIAGVTVRVAERAFREMGERPYRYHKCGQKHLKGVEGYPGEHFIICGRCGDVLEVQFSLSEVV